MEHFLFISHLWLNNIIGRGWNHCPIMLTATKTWEVTEVAHVTHVGKVPLSFRRPRNGPASLTSWTSGSTTLRTGHFEEATCKVWVCKRTIPTIFGGFSVGNMIETARKIDLKKVFQGIAMVFEGFFHFCDLFGQDAMETRRAAQQREVDRLWPGIDDLGGYPHDLGNQKKCTSSGLIFLKLLAASFIFIYNIYYIYICILTCFYESWQGGTAYVCIFRHHGHSTAVVRWEPLERSLPVATFLVGDNCVQRCVYIQYHLFSFHKSRSVHIYII